MPSHSPKGKADIGKEEMYRCGGLNEKCSHMLMFEYLVSSWWNCFGRIRKCGLAGEGVSQRAVCGVSKVLYHSLCSLPPAYGSKCGPSDAPANMPATCCHDVLP